MNHPAPIPRVAIACGGTGGHIFPGLAVAGELVKRGCAVTLLISPKEVDRQAVQTVPGLEIKVLPAVGLDRRGGLGFLRGLAKSWVLSQRLFCNQPPQAVLAMGGFTAAPPVFAARLKGIPAFLHESNTIPGRANRLLAGLVKQAFVGFPEAAHRLRARDVTVTGTPVRPQFQPGAAAVCRAALGLPPDRPVVLVMGGSQGASGVNDLVIASLPLLDRIAPDWQWLHLTGPGDLPRVEEAYRSLKREKSSAVVLPFLERMELALGAATVAVSRAGASTLAELAAMRVPAVLIPYPAAKNNHQFYNANAFATTAAAQLLEQKDATPEKLAGRLLDLVRNSRLREQMQASLAQWHRPGAAEQIAKNILGAVSERSSLAPQSGGRPHQLGGEASLKAVT
jgi:UDP-N-acetylglucosamine--N-acetylmuramyl-(pentapeptide) pyrophosphoryl-undecaprenol N-acetylglucosamine transferase